jgi:hypothetical protein
MGEDLGSSQRAPRLFPYHAEGDGLSKPSKIGHSMPSGPSKPREGSKRQHVDED